ncbi:uncharacterized protein LOC112570620 [Pomacea canaliculata]|uniref:uncharacterized protein LOC112570620 n=1 Tax=Pomacea canaliculata TaxID=400727 RepID=UPI000D732DD1|nr:uncharacterized protein LOC112570620 [Pomacea canaliculata]
MERVALLALLALVVCAASVGVTSLQSCGKTCSCQDVDDDDEPQVLTKLEGLAAAVGVLTPLVVGVAGLGLYHLLKPASAGLEPRVSASPRPTFTNKPSPPSSWRGSSPVSVFSEDDEATFYPSDNDAWKSPRPDTSSTYTNIHRPSKADSINRWM